MTSSGEMTYEEPVQDDEKKIKEPEIVRFRGKDVKIEKLKRKVNRKPRILGTMLINFSIIIVIIIVLLLLFF